MSELDPNYPVMEIAICLVDYAPLPSGHERALVGDIVAVRKPSVGIGVKEAKLYLWLRVEGVEDGEFPKLVNYIMDSTSDVIYDKRRYCISLEKLKENYPYFDIDLALDQDTIYQPFLLLDDDYTFILENDVQPFQVNGLIYDKITGDYL